MIKLLLSLRKLKNALPKIIEALEKVEELSRMVPGSQPDQTLREILSFLRKLV